MKKSAAMIYNFGSILCWSVSPLMIRYVKDYFSVSFQNLFRFAVSIIILWIFTLSTVGGRTAAAALKPFGRKLPKFLAVALCNFTHQLFLIKGVYILLPGFVTIVEESTIIFAVLLAFAFIPQERMLITRPLFVVGLMLAVAGVFLTAVPELSVPSMISASTGSSAVGIVYVLISSLAWALFSLMVRLWFPHTPSPVISSVVFSLVIPFFIISMLLSGGPGIMASDVPVSAWIILASSGLVGIGFGYSFYYQALKGLGVTLTSSLSLVIPLISALLSYFIYGETFSAVQLAGTAVLLFGCLLIVRISPD